MSDVSPEVRVSFLPVCLITLPARNRMSPRRTESESESERYLFDPHKKLIQSNNVKQLGSGDPY